MPMKTLLKLLGALLVYSVALCFAGCEDEVSEFDLTGKWYQCNEEGIVPDGGCLMLKTNKDGSFHNIHIRGFDSDEPYSETEGKYTFENKVLTFWYPIEDENGEESLKVILTCRLTERRGDIIKLELIEKLPNCLTVPLPGGMGTFSYNPLWSRDDTVLYLTKTNR